MSASIRARGAQLMARSTSGSAMPPVVEGESQAPNEATLVESRERANSLPQHEAEFTRDAGPKRVSLWDLDQLLGPQPLPNFDIPQPVPPPAPPLPDARDNEVANKQTKTNE